MEIKIGADPELFVRDLSTGKLISAAGLVPGTKDEPFKVPYGAIQVDGMALEYNINPAINPSQFAAYNIAVLYALRNEVIKHNPNLKFEFEFCPVAHFGAEYIQAQPEDVRRLGCTPDYNAHNDGKENPTPDADMPFRTASGHIHVGWGDMGEYDIADPEHIDACCMLVKELDFWLLPTIALTERKNYGKDGMIRRELYGKAGAFRPKSYGVEYRSPSNVWLNDVNSMKWMWGQTYDAFFRLMRGNGYSSNSNNLNSVLKKVESGNIRDLSDIGQDMLDKWNTSSHGKVSVYNLDVYTEVYKRQIPNIEKFDFNQEKVAVVPNKVVRGKKAAGFVIDDFGIPVQQGWPERVIGPGAAIPGAIVDAPAVAQPGVWAADIDVIEQALRRHQRADAGALFGVEV